MKAHKHIKDQHTPAHEPRTWVNFLTFTLLLVIGMFGLLLISSCMQAQSREGTVISKGDQHDS